MKSFLKYWLISLAIVSGLFFVWDILPSIEDGYILTAPCLEQTDWNVYGDGGECLRYGDSVAISIPEYVFGEIPTWIFFSIIVGWLVWAYKQHD